jgi:hypothetical protein
MARGPQVQGGNAQEGDDSAARYRNPDMGQGAANSSMRRAEAGTSLVPCPLIATYGEALS